MPDVLLLEKKTVLCITLQVSLPGKHTFRITLRIDRHTQTWKGRPVTTLVASGLGFSGSIATPTAGRRESGKPLVILLMIQKSGEHQLIWYMTPILCRVSYMSGGAGFLPSTVHHPTKSTSQIQGKACCKERKEKIPPIPSPKKEKRIKISLTQTHKLSQ